MGKTRSIHAQLNYCISQSCHIGESKRQYMQNHNGQTDDRIFSIQHAKNLRETANSFSKFMKANFSDVKMAKDIKSEHIQSYLEANSKNWSKRTLETKAGQLTKIVSTVNSTYHSNIKLDVTLPSEVKTVETIRNKMMEPEDFQKLRSYFDGKKTQSAKAIEITARCGLRVKEVAHLKAENIDLEKNMIYVREGAKNGKFRDVPIREKDMPYFTELKANCATGYVTEGNTENALNKGIRRAMHDLKISEKYHCTGEHSIRKMYATDRMNEERAKGLDEKSAWSVVQEELGHTSTFRPELYRVYVKR